MSQFSHQTAFRQRNDLAPYGDNARLLYALETRLRLDDVLTVASNSLTDGPDDKKCDLVYVDRESGSAVIAQGFESTKMRSEAPSNKASDLNTAVTWLLARDLADLPESLRSAAEELRSAIRDKSLRTLQVWYVHNLPESQNVKSELKTVEHSLKTVLDQYFPGNEIEDRSATEVGQKTLEEWHLALQTPILVSDKIAVDVPGAYTISGDKWEAVVTALPASWLHDLWKRYGTALFSANVREYLGSRKSTRNVNHNIKQTAQTSAGKFWVYNNGVTALVHNFKLGEGRLEITGLSIVNGAQTTGAIGSLESPPGADAHVPARFVKCNDAQTVQRIIQFNNTQNVVQASDFRSNDPVQRRLRDEFEQIPNATYLGGRRGSHEDVIRRPGNLLPTDTCAQALAAFHQEPYRAYNSKSLILDDDGIYSQYFSEKTTANHIVLAFSLLRAVEQKKRALVISASRTSQEDTQLAFFRNRGTTFLFCAAIASCIETFLGHAVPNPFRLSFKGVAPDRAVHIWMPVIETVVPFASYLAPAVQDGLRNRSEIGKAISAFQSLVEATKGSNARVFEEFRRKVVS